MAATRSYEISWLDPAYMAAHPDCDLEKATRRVNWPTRAAALRYGKRKAGEINGTVYLQMFIKTQHGWDAEGEQEEITQ